MTLFEVLFGYTPNFAQELKNSTELNPSFNRTAPGFPPKAPRLGLFSSPQLSQKILN
jgi:hypothetical protein